MFRILTCSLSSTVLTPSYLPIFPAPPLPPPSFDLQSPPPSLFLIPPPPGTCGGCHACACPSSEGAREVGSSQRGGGHRGPSIEGGGYHGKGPQEAGQGGCTCKEAAKEAEEATAAEVAVDIRQRAVQ